MCGEEGRGGISADGQPLSRETQRSVGRPSAALTNFSGERNKILVSILGFRVDARKFRLKVRNRTTGKKRRRRRRRRKKQPVEETGNKTSPRDNKRSLSFEGWKSCWSVILLLRKESILTVPRLRAGCSLTVQEFLPIADGGLPPRRRKSQLGNRLNAN